MVTDKVLLTTTWKGNKKIFNNLVKDRRFSFKNEETRRVAHQVLKNNYYMVGNPVHFDDSRLLRLLDEDTLLKLKSTFENVGITKLMVDMAKYNNFTIRIEKNSSDDNSMSLVVKNYDENDEMVFSGQCWFGRQLFDLLKFRVGDNKRDKISLD